MNYKMDIFKSIQEGQLRGKLHIIHEVSPTEDEILANVLNHKGLEIENQEIMKGKKAALGEIRIYSGISYKKVSETGNPNKDWQRVKNSESSPAEDSKSDKKPATDSEQSEHEKLIKPSKDSKVAVSETKQSPKKVDKSPSIDSFNFKENIDYYGKYLATQEVVAKLNGVENMHHLNPKMSTYVGDVMVNKIRQEVIAKIGEPPEGISESVFPIDTPNLSQDDLKNYYLNKKIPYSLRLGFEFITRKVKETYRLINDPKYKNSINKLQDYLKSSGDSIKVLAMESEIFEGGVGIVSFAINETNDSNKYSGGVKGKMLFLPDGTIRYSEVAEKFEKMASDPDIEAEGLYRAKYIKKFMDKMDIPYGKELTNIDEEWTKLKDKYGNYYHTNQSGWSSKQPFSSLNRIDDDTYDFTVGDCGKKKDPVDTVNDAYGLTPPSEINGHKLIGMVNHKGEVVDSKIEYKKEIAGAKNQGWSEYENNVSVTYRYKKK